MKKNTFKILFVGVLAPAIFGVIGYVSIYLMILLLTWILGTTYEHAGKLSGIAAVLFACIGVYAAFLNIRGK